jgi:hypothetical protein
MPKPRPAAQTEVVVGDMGSALASMIGRYFEIPAADRAAALNREHHVRENRAAAYHVACHS